MTTSSDAEAVLKIVTVAMTVVDVEILVKALVIPEAASVGTRGRAATSRSVVATTSHESAAKMLVGILEATSVTAMVSRRMVVFSLVAMEARLVANLDASSVGETIQLLPVRVAEETPPDSRQQRATSGISSGSSMATSLVLVLR